MLAVSSDVIDPHVVVFRDLVSIMILEVTTLVPMDLDRVKENDFIEL